MQVDAHHRHDEERRGQHQGDGQGDDQAGAPAERQERDHEHDADRLAERLQKLVDRLADDLRLVGDAAELDADRQVLLDALQRCSTAAPTSVTLAPGAMVVPSSTASRPW